MGEKLNDYLYYYTDFSGTLWEKKLPKSAKPEKILHLIQINDYSVRDLIWVWGFII